MSSTTAQDPQAQSSVTAAPEAFTPKPAFERTLVFIVVLLGIAIIGGLAAVVLRIVYLSSRPAAPTAPVKSAQSQPQVLPSAHEEGLQLALPTGAVVKGTALDGNRLAVTYEGPEGTGIAVIDLGSGQTVARVRIEAK